MIDTHKLASSELGKKSDYDSHYNPDKLLALSRQLKREEIGITNVLPFYGFDRWNHYEVSWLNLKGKPMVALAHITYPADSPYLIESKSMKLYFNSFNNTKFKDCSTIKEIITQDLSERVGAPTMVEITLLEHVNSFLQPNFSGIGIDHLDIDCNTYLTTPEFLTTENEIVTETLYSHLLKSNCLVTNQPDWGSVQIHYQGKKIERSGLLKYIISFRNHNEFHEQCIERIFMDIMRQCQPKTLTVYGRYTRRGGLDINPYRSTYPVNPLDIIEQRLCRQ